MGREMPLSRSVADARDARAADRLNEADPGAMPRLRYARPTALRSCLRREAAWGDGLSRTPLGTLTMTWDQREKQ
jgi:hypothetical protein